ncbi:MAG: hypothetical protein O7H39_06485, partial [Gammaproteobacteria bacterium]|nr:hypothetical protein [Gammaproteobacteria bacterium]
LFPMLLVAGYTVFRELGARLHNKAKSAVVAALAAVVASFHFYTYDPVGVYPWLHLTSVKSAIVAMRERESSPHVCYEWVYDVVFEYYGNAYGWETVADCNEETARFVLFSSATSNRLAQRPEATVLMRDDPDFHSERSRIADGT